MLFGLDLTKNIRHREAHELYKLGFGPELSQVIKRNNNLKEYGRWETRTRWETKTRTVKKTREVEKTKQEHVVGWETRTYDQMTIGKEVVNWRVTFNTLPNNFGSEMANSGQGNGQITCECSKNGAKNNYTIMSYSADNIEYILSHSFANHFRWDNNAGKFLTTPVYPVVITFKSDFSAGTSGVTSCIIKTNNLQNSTLLTKILSIVKFEEYVDYYKTVPYTVTEEYDDVEEYQELVEYQVWV